MAKFDEWRLFGGSVELKNKDMQVDSVDMEVMVRDTTSRDEQNQEVPFVFTDLQFQPGAQKTGWMPNTKEMLKKVKFDVDENRRYAGGSWTFPIGAEPNFYTADQIGEKRLFNIMGRGHETIVMPNHLPEPEFWQLSTLQENGLERPVEILTTGIDFTIMAKDDFDIMRISTGAGAWMSGESRSYHDIIQNYEQENPNTIESIFRSHPLHKRYTREFWFDGGLAGDELKCHASALVSSVNGIPTSHRGVNEFQIGDTTINIYRNKFHLIPRGSVRFRIEFYKKTTMTLVDNDGIDQIVEYLKDTGIGYQGTATFDQWTYGVERL